MSKSATGLFPEKKILRTDNTALNDFRVCPAKFMYRIVSGMVPRSEVEAPHPSLSLHYGIAWHKAMDELYENKDLSTAIDAWYEASKGLAEDKYNRKTIGRGAEDLQEYYLRYGNELTSMDLLQSEAIAITSIPFCVGDETWTLEYVGAIDKILRVGNTIRLRDHKTTGYITSNTAVLYELSNQLLGYAYMAREFFGFEEENLIVDADIVAPTRVKPPSEFLRPEIEASASMVAEWKREIQITAGMIVSLYLNGEGIWPRYGHDACGRYGNRCQYFDLCAASDNMRHIIVDAQYTESVWDPGARNGEEE